MAKTELKIPDLGDFTDVDVIEVMVKPGDEIDVEDPVITLETDKAAMDVPATEAGTVAEVHVSVGDTVSEGDLVLTLETGGDGADEDDGDEGEEPAHDSTVVMDPAERDRALAEAGGDSGEAGDDEESSGGGSEAAGDDEGPSEGDSSAAGDDDASSGDGSSAAGDGERSSGGEPAAADRPSGKATHSAGLVVIGSGPGGYTAAFRAADLGLDVVLIERYPSLGGVCLNVGCIPSKALLHAAKVIDDAAAMASHGIRFGNPEIDAAALNEWKAGVVGRLTGGIAKLAKARKVRVIEATATFESANRLALDNGETVDFEQCIIAAGSQAATLPDTPDDPRIVDSTGALEIDPLPERMLLVGGGIIGLEMACVYAALGSEVSVVELTDQLMPGTDPDLVRPFQKIIKERYESIMLGTKVSNMKPTKAGIEVSFEGKNAPIAQRYDRVLIAVGRRANGDKLDADKAGVEVGERGIIPVDKQMRTNVPHIFAIGDLAGEPMLAHKASHEGKVAAEVAAGEKRAFDARGIPSVAYTDPEIAWVGLTETEAKEQGVDYDKAQFPWAASGRALALGRDEGFTKLLFDKQNGRLLGAGIVGPGAGELIAEVGLALEMGADPADIGLTIHPHPTLSETVAFAAEAQEGTLTDLYLPKKR